ncbi:flagellar assembly protein FliW [Thalassospira mesophila]|uniref:flagellar assembly protein FliW n=1 Tax=Thalassospira mesophila TaxID=1293891 RepID=UPI000A1E30E0|nr:flagellar assembly protein FliW [Thalassospira mesophila]
MTEQKINDANIPKSILVETRFGDIEFVWERALYMPVGLLGFADQHVFGLANIPGKSLDQFKLYQSLTDADLSFIVAPYNMESGIYSNTDIERAGQSLAIPQEDMAILLIVTVRPTGDNQNFTMSVNLQAPVILNTTRQIAWQHIMPHDKYPVQHDI